MAKGHLVSCPLQSSSRLPGALQERQFERVGGNRILTTEVRIVSATNRDLTAAITAGAFRADLLYRLNVFPIGVPRLRKWKEDIPMLVEYFVKRYAEKIGKQICKIDNKTLEPCQSHPWPGNIRELQNIRSAPNSGCHTKLKLHCGINSRPVSSRHLRSARKAGPLAHRIRESLV